MLNQTWQDKITFTMDQLLMGTGWHEVEKDGEIYFRWMGPEPTATIHLLPRRDRDNRLNITFHGCIGRDVLEGLKVQADGTPLTVAVSQHSPSDPGPWYLTAILPRDRVKSVDQPTVLSLHAPGCAAEKEIHPAGKSDRRVCAALRCIDIFPLGRPLFTAQKYADPVPFDGLHFLREHPEARDGIVQGFHASAYAYYQKHRHDTGRYTPRLHPAFDECPGDLYDILRDEMNERCRELEGKYRQEISLLREMVYRQGDMIRKRKGKD